MDKQERRQAAASYKAQVQRGGVYAIRCKQNGKRLLLATSDMAGSENRFRFAQATGGCVHPKLRADWDAYTGAGFEFETVEALTQRKEQTDAEFRGEVDALLEMLMAQSRPEEMY